MVLSVSFLQLGQFALTSGDAWVTLAVVRTIGVIDCVVGGWSAMLRVLLEQLFLGDLGLATVGLPLNLSQQAPVMLFAALTNFLADGDGLRSAYDWRGASSLKPCLVHHNVLKKVTRLALAMWGVDGFSDRFIWRSKPTDHIVKSSPLGLRSGSSRRRLLRHRLPCVRGFQNVAGR